MVITGVYMCVTKLVVISTHMYTLLSKYSYISMLFCTENITKNCIRHIESVKTRVFQLF